MSSKFLLLLFICSTLVLGGCLKLDDRYIVNDCSECPSDRWCYEDQSIYHNTWCVESPYYWREWENKTLYNSTFDITEPLDIYTRCETEMKYIQFNKNESTYYICYRCLDENKSIMPGFVEPGDWVCAI